MENVSPCPNCGGRALYRSGRISSGGNHAPDYLPGLGTFLRSGGFELVVCKDCGLTRFFARPEARAKLSPESKKWTQI